MRLPLVFVTTVASVVALVTAGARGGDMPGQRSVAGVPNTGTSSRPFLVAHRGASAYAPEHTLAAYRLALEQGADYVEQDLTLTRDGVLICLHDDTLERTTDVEARFPDRAVEERDRDGRPVNRWYANRSEEHT